MSPRRLLHIPRHTLRITAYVLAFTLGAGILLFFGLTRTQIGRDGLRRQIEQQFVETFEGRLEIGTLTGNLVQDLFAADVELYDGNGNLVLYIDSLIARPNVQDLLRRRFSVSSLTLIQPTFHLRYTRDSTWNITDVFRRKKLPRPPGSSTWSFDSAELNLVDGAFHTRHDEQVPPLVAQGRLFNYAHVDAQDLQARATIEWGADVKLIDVLRFTVQLPDMGITVDNLQGQLLLEERRTLLNQLIVEAGRTSVQFDGAINRTDASATQPGGTLALDLELRDSRFDGNQIRRLVPFLPLADELSASLQVAGPLSDLIVDDVRLVRGRSRIQADGRLQGLPDSLHVHLNVPDSRLDATDVEALLPTVALPDLRHIGPLAISGTIEGTAHRGSTPAFDAFHTVTDFDVRGAPGRMAGTLSFQQERGLPPRYTLDAGLDSLDLGRLADDPRLQSRLRGRMALRGRHFHPDSLNAAVRLDLFPSTVAQRQIDTLHVDASMVERRLEATVFVRRERQGLFANAVLNYNTPLPRYQLGLITRQLDLGPLLSVDSLYSSLNSQWSLEGTGTSWDDVHGELSVAFDSSRVQWGETARALLPQRSVLTINHPDAPAPRLIVDGDALTLRLDAPPSAAAVRAVTSLWRTIWEETWNRQAEKTYAQALQQRPPATAVLDAPSLDQILLQEEARARLDAAGLDTVAVTIDLAVKQAGLLNGFFPMLPPLQTDLHLHARIASQADRVQLTATARGDSLHTPGFFTNRFHAALQASATLDAPLEETLGLTLDVQSDSLWTIRQPFDTPHLSARYHHRNGTISVSTNRTNRTEPAHLTAALALLPDRYRLTIQDFGVVLGDYVWQQPEAQSLDLFTDAAVFSEVVFQSRLAGDDQTQRVRLRGTLSSLPQDTMFVEVEDIGLRQLSDFLALKQSLGGRLNAGIALTGVSQREVTGALTVDALSLDDRLLGHLTVSSRYIPGSPDVALDVSLLPITADDPLLPTSSSDLEHTENELTLAGTFRLPKGEEDPGVLDLRLDAERADAFFFEYILSDVDNVAGAFAGDGAIRGTFSYPLFQADLTLTDGQFDVPKFNLHYRIDGPVRVDDDGIHLDQVVVRDPTDGTATIAGSILFNEYRFFSFDLNGQLRDVQIINVPTFSRELPFYGSIWATADVTMTGPLYNTFLRSTNVVTSEHSDLFIPITTAATVVDPGFIIYADSTGQIPDLTSQLRRNNILASRPVGERTLVEGMEMDLNILAPQGSTVHLVIDPLLGDVINAVGSGRIQLQRREGDFYTFGRFDVDAGDYLFTASEVFIRRFIINDGTINWTGNPLNPNLDIEAAYQTRASRTGLPPDIAQRLQSTIPLIVQLHITGELNAVLVDLNLAVDRSRQEAISNTPYLETYLNQPDRAAEYATSVLLTNSFLLTTESSSNDVLAGSAFNSVSALVSSQLNRYLSEVIPNADFTFGVQSDEQADDLDVSAGVAIRLLNERLIIRGEGVYSGLGDNVDDTAQQGLQGEFIVEIRLSPSVSIEVFYRREGDILSESLLTSETGAGLSYRTQFSTWRTLFRRLFGKEEETAPAPDSTTTPVVEARDR